MVTSLLSYHTLGVCKKTIEEGIVVSLIQIIYVSKETKKMNREEFRALVNTAKRNNSKYITGALYYGNGKFIQIIEGKDKRVIQLYSKILSDPRHNDVYTLAMRPIRNRFFSKWGMGKIDAAKQRIYANKVLSFNRNKPGVWNDATWDEILHSFRKYITD